VAGPTLVYICCTISLLIEWDLGGLNLVQPDDLFLLLP
jgi:hypothetical protein